MREDKQDEMMLTMMGDIGMAMQMMRPKMMAIMREIKAGKRGEMIKHTVQKMQKSEHDGMMKATAEEMMRVMRTDVKKRMMMSVVAEMTTEWRGMKKHKQEEKMLAMMGDMNVAMKMMKPKMMARMKEMRAGRKGKMMKAMVEDMQEEEHETMMKATAEEMMRVMKEMRAGRKGKMMKAMVE